MTYKREDKEFKLELSVVERLAKELHVFYRAAFKALHTGRLIPGQIGAQRNCIQEHDHGWRNCHKRAYFMKRAKQILRSNQ